MPRLVLFAAIREIAGEAHGDFGGGTVHEVLECAVAKYGGDFERLLRHCNIMVGSDPADRDTAVQDGDEIAVLPPVSGG